MKVSIFAAAASVCFSLAATLPALAEPVAFAANERGAWGGAIGHGSQAGAEDYAMSRCGGTANGCKIVMSADGDCIAYSEAVPSSGGYYYWIGYTVAENAYNRSGELQKVTDMVMNWCKSGAPSDAPCKLVHANCASYITNLN